MFAWQSEGRLRPLHMVWLEHNYNEPVYELIKWRAPSLKRMPRLGPFLIRESRVDLDRERRQRFPGRTGHWFGPRSRKAKRKSCRQKPARN
jgi:hypothetical protein